jgi:prepilin-type N-terminal cleavage/methylation domain-containing protein
VARKKTKTLFPGKTSRGHQDGQKGITLLEIIVVLAIIGLLVALSTPRLYNSWRNLQCKRAATSFASLLRYAHQQAILRKEPQTIRIDLDGLTTRLLPPKAVSHEGEDGKVKKTTSPVTYTFPSSVRPRLIIPERATVIDSGQRDILFYPTGNSTGEIIELVNVLGNIYRISLDPVTGSPTISRGEP